MIETIISRQLHQRAEQRTTALDHAQARPAYCRQVLENTSDNAECRPDSAALSRPYSVKVSGVQMGHCASVAAPRCRSFQHLHSHPLSRENGAGGSQLTTEPETMTTSKVGTFAAASALQAHTPPHYLRRIARSIMIRAAVRGHISWFVALHMLALIEGSAA